MKATRSLIRLALLLFFCCPSLAALAQKRKVQPPVMKPDSLIASDSLLKDLYELKSAILESHVGPFTFCTEREFHDSFQRAALYLKEKDRTYFEFAVATAQAISVMKDSHTNVDFNHFIELQLSNKGYFLPLRITSVENHLYLSTVRAVDSLNFPKVGCELIKLNGVKLLPIYEKALTHSLTEGESITGKRRVADVQLTTLLGMYIPLDSLNELEIIPFGKTEPETVTVRAYDKAAFDERKKEIMKSDWLNTIQHRMLNDSVAYLKIGTFAPSDRKKFEKELNAFFKEINKKQVPALVIDIRDNGGGSSTLVEHTFAYLTDQGYNTPSNIIGRNSELALTRFPLLKHGFIRAGMKILYKRNEDIVAFARLAGKPFGVNDTLYFTKPAHHPKDEIYQGKCALLVNGLSASASVDFTNAFIKAKKGLVIGEPIMGPSKGTWGNSTVKQLSRTKLRVNVATIRYNYDNSFQYIATPIKPDLMVVPSQEDIATGTDAGLELAKQRILK